MKNLMKYGVGLTTSLLLVTACTAKADPEGIAEATQEIQNAQSEFLTIDKDLYTHEQNLNEQFNKLVTEDEDLTSIKDESAQVIENLNQREEILTGLTEQEETIREKAEYIGTYEGEELPADEIQQISDDFLAFADDIASYQKGYQEEIDFERNYFTEIASDEADYEDFINGLNDLNFNYAEFQKDKLKMDDTFAHMNEQSEEIKSLTNGVNPDSVDKTADAEEENKEETKELAEEEIDEDVAEDAEQSEEEASEETADNAEESNKDADNENREFLAVNTDDLLKLPRRFPKKFLYESGVDIAYPEGGVKGIYTTAHSAGGERMESLINLINTTDLNAMVIDIKDDHGNITIDLDSDNELVTEMTNEMIDVEELMSILEENNIYPIARIVVFKDSLLAESKPEWSFTEEDGSVWFNRRGESFVNPYLEEVWDYNIEVAVQAAKLGFKDIQYDYVRFPEGFENRADTLSYSHGSYADDSEDVISMEYRNRAVTEFVRKSKESLMPYGVDLSVDIFGYAAVVRETPGIGQSFPNLSKEVDVVSSMIYPSHWGPGNLDISKPDLEPYNVVNNYMKIEKEIFDELGDEAPITRPWIQDFTASYLGAGNYIGSLSNGVDRYI